MGDVINKFIALSALDFRLDPYAPCMEPVCRITLLIPREDKCLTEPEHCFCTQCAATEIGLNILKMNIISL